MKKEKSDRGDERDQRHGEERRVCIRSGESNNVKGCERGLERDGGEGKRGPSETREKVKEVKERAEGWRGRKGAR